MCNLTGFIAAGHLKLPQIRQGPPQRLRLSSHKPDIPGNLVHDSGNGKTFIRTGEMNPHAFVFKRLPGKQGKTGMRNKGKSSENQFPHIRHIDFLLFIPPFNQPLDLSGELFTMGFHVSGIGGIVVERAINVFRHDKKRVFRIETL